MTIDEFLRVYWNNYLLLEEKFIKTLSYVDLNTSNEQTFSLEYANLIQCLGAELLTVMKKMFGSNGSRDNMRLFYKSIKENSSVVKLEDIKTQEILIVGYDIVLKPFEKWVEESPSKSLEWFEAYNSLKHDRENNFSEANQKNTLYLLAALFLMEIYYYRKLISSDAQPQVPLNSSEFFVAKGITDAYIYGKLNSSAFIDYSSDINGV